MQFTRQNKTGFTFIEIIIVTSMLCVISLATYAVLNKGIKIWQRVHQPTPYEDVNIFFDKFAFDLQNSFKFKDIVFLGQKHILGFPTLVDSPNLKARTIGQVIYFYNPQQNELKREQKDFSQIYNNSDGIIAQSLSGIRSLQFQYYLYDEQIETYSWQEDHSSDKLPLAVRLELELIDAGKTYAFSKTVSIPVNN